jgi:RNA polymerase sigma-B factor
MSVYRADEIATEVRDERDQFTRSLLHEAAEVTDPDVRQCLLEQAVLLNLSLARALSRQYRRQGVDPDDLEQVAMLGLVKAVHGYCPWVENNFSAYAVPTISGEIKRYFRDRGWMVRPPRSLQELNRAVRIAEADLAQMLQRMPTTDELAEHVAVEAGSVDAAREAGAGYQARSLDHRLGDSGQQLCDVVADPHDPFELVDTVLTLRPALETLAERERHILQLRFFDNLTQEEIGRRLGVSQMQVSRLLTAILAKLRQIIQEQQAA